jgi:hypothetical protein
LKVRRLQVKYGLQVKTLLPVLLEIFKPFNLPTFQLSTFQPSTLETLHLYKKA